MNKKLELPPPSCVHFIYIFEVWVVGRLSAFPIGFWYVLVTFQGRTVKLFLGGGEGENLIVLSYRLLPCDHPERRWWSNHLPGENYDIYMYIYKYIFK